MALHPNFPDDPHAILDPTIRWFPADETLRTTSFEKLLPPLVPTLRKEVQAWRDSGYDGATETSTSLLRWWFDEQHLLAKADGTAEEFQYFFAQREALETIVFLYDVVGVKDKFDLLRFDSSGTVSTGMFDETWRRFVVKMATGTSKTKSALSARRAISFSRTSIACTPATSRFRPPMTTTQWTISLARDRPAELPTAKSIWE
jgi:type III restriction enzyme